MARHFSVYVAVLVMFVSYDGLFIEAACPSSLEEAEARAKLCLRRIGLDFEAGAFGQDVRKMKQYCDDGSLNSTLGCVDEVFIDCSNTNDFDKVISVSQLRRGFNYLCNNIQVLIDNGRCIGEQQNGVAVCLQEEGKRLQSEIKAMQDSGSQPSKDDVNQLGCSFLDRLFSCQRDLYKDNCNQKAADILTYVMQSAKPQFCADYSGAPTSSGISWTLLACLIGLCMYMT